MDVKFSPWHDKRVRQTNSDLLTICGLSTN